MHVAKKKSGLMRDEVCPKCCSQDVGVWSFNSDTVDYECYRCRHRWTARREASDEFVPSYNDVASYRECKRKKFDASSLEEFCCKFRDYEDGEVEVWPYLPRRTVKGERDFGLIVESGHVRYEVGLSGVLFVDDNRFLRRWVLSPRSFVLDVSPIGMFEDFARGLSRYLTQKGCHAVANEIQHMDRTPKETVGDEDLKIVTHIITEYC